MKSITIVDQITNDQITFWDNKVGTILRTFEGFEYPEVRASIDDLAGDYGAAYITSKYGKRRLAFEGDLVTDDVWQLRRNIVTILRQRGRMKLLKFTTYDDLALQCEVEIVKMINPYTHQVHTFLIEAIAPDWRFYSQELKSIDIEKTSISGGVAIPTEIPLELTLSDESGDQNRIITNEGNEVSDPIITIYGPGTDFTVGNDTTEQEFTIEETLIEGEYITIDVKNRTVTKDDGTNLYSSFTGEWWSIQPGDNIFRLLVDSGSDIATKAHIAFRDAYGGI